MSSLNYEPITPLSDSDRHVYLADADSVKEALDGRRAQAEAHGADIESVFERLKRELAVETGLLERLYDIDRGQTTLLIEHGFVADRLARVSGKRTPMEVVALLDDQREAIEVVYDWVSRRRQLSTHGIKEIHSLLTRNQHTTEALTQLGTVVDVPLEKGVFKSRPNNPRRKDGTIHEYCPPLSVPTEMENLIRWFGEYDDVHPIIQSAWLHHRFTQIHPFQDGNGRVARCLANFVLIRGGWIPLVITRDDRNEYLDALEQADAGSLSGLIRHFARVLIDRSVKLTAQFRTASARRSLGPSSTAAEKARRIAETTRQGEPDWVENHMSWISEASSAIESALSRLVAEINQPFIEQGSDRLLSPPTRVTEGPEVEDDALSAAVQQIQRASSYGKQFGALGDWVSVEATVRGARRKLVVARFIPYDIFEPEAANPIPVGAFLRQQDGTYRPVLNDLVVLFSEEPMAGAWERLDRFLDRALSAFLDELFGTV